MLSLKRIQRLFRPSRLSRLSSETDLHSLVGKQVSADKTSNDTNLNRDQVLEIYDWISQINSQSNSARKLV